MHAARATQLDDGDRLSAGDITFLGKICVSRETGLGVGQAAVM
jgi:hypothetical protein